MTYVGYGVIALFLLIHWGIHRVVHRTLCVDVHGVFLEIPFPLWVHLIIMWPALLITIVLIWLAGFLV